jgi:hypothetical protein
VNESWKQIDEENELLYEKRMEGAKKASAADRDFFGAVQSARRSVKQDELLPVRDEFGELRYTVRQGLKAACYAREDASATLELQRPVLRRLDRIQDTLWVVLAFLAYIAYRVS